MPGRADFCAGTRSHEWSARGWTRSLPLRYAPGLQTSKRKKRCQRKYPQLNHPHSELRPDPYLKPDSFGSATRASSEIQLSKRDVLETLSKGRGLFTFSEWRDFLLRSVGLEPGALPERTRDVMLLRMVPFV